MADRGIGSRRSSPNSLWPLPRHLRRRRLLSVNATDPVGDRGLVALRLASWPRSYLGGGACEIWPVANATLSLRLIASCRISATARPFRAGQPLRAESRTLELDAARLAGPARLGAYWGGRDGRRRRGLAERQPAVGCGSRCYGIGGGRSRRGELWVVWRPVSRVSKPYSNRPCWSTPPLRGS
jgi:hypothetical protein